MPRIGINAPFRLHFHRGRPRADRRAVQAARLGAFTGKVGVELERGLAVRAAAGSVLAGWLGNRPAFSYPTRCCYRRHVDTPDLGSLGFTEEKLYDVKNDIVGFDATRDGKFLFWFERGNDGRVIPVVNGAPGASFDAFVAPFEHLRRWQRQRLRWLVGKSDYKFSGDGRRFAYVGRRRKGFFISIDGVQSREYKAIGGDPYFDPTGSTSFYVARVDVVNRLVLNGEVQLEYEVVSPPHSSPPRLSRNDATAKVAAARRCSDTAGADRDRRAPWLVLEIIGSKR
jgi:hypothetical protein